MIAIFGASITQQKSGYAARLKEKLNQPVRVFGHGGMSLKDAAICLIDKVIEENPTYCFVDWFSTAYNKVDDDTIQYIDTIIYKFSKLKCKLIFLFFPYKNIPEKKEFYVFCRSVLINREISFIDVNYEIDNSELNTILRDDMHTTEYGSHLYAQIIHKNFEKIKNHIKIPTDIRPTKYIHIKKIVVNRMFDDRIGLEGYCEIIGFYLTIGPHSGIVEVDNGKELQIYNTWDRWCYYPRKHFNLPMEIRGNVRLNILQKNFDISSCHEQVDFKNKKKKLIVHEIYYIGDYLHIKNINEGLKINNISILTGIVIGRVNQYKKRIFRKFF